MKPLRIAAITDHLDGHSRQVEAMVEVIGEARPVEVVNLRASRDRLQPPAQCRL